MISQFLTKQGSGKQPALGCGRIFQLGAAVSYSIQAVAMGQFAYNRGTMLTASVSFHS